MKTETENSRGRDRQEKETNSSKKSFI